MCFCHGPGAVTAGNKVFVLTELGQSAVQQRRPQRSGQSQKQSQAKWSKCRFFTGQRDEEKLRWKLGLDRAAILQVSGFAGCEAASFRLARGSDLKSQIFSPELRKCHTNLCTDYCKSLPTHRRNTVTGVLFILFLFLSCCHFSETIAIRSSLAGFGLCRVGTSRFRTGGSRAQAQPECIPSWKSFFLADQTWPVKRPF